MIDLDIDDSRSHAGQRLASCDISIMAQQVIGAICQSSHPRHGVEHMLLSKTCKVKIGMFMVLSLTLTHNVITSLREGSRMLVCNCCFLHCPVPLSIPDNILPQGHHSHHLCVYLPALKILPEGSMKILIGTNLLSH